MRGLGSGFFLLSCLALGGSCGSSASAGPRLHHIQMKGTHNSYHLAPSPFVVVDLDYSLPPLEDQLSSMGVRQFELDVHWRAEASRFAVYHIPYADEGTRCYWFADCLSIFKAWSDAHPHHHPLFIFLEPKDEIDPSPILGHYEDLEAEILSVWPGERVLTPEEARGSAPTLREAVTQDGWPPVSDLRGRAVFVMLDTGTHRARYTFSRTSLDGRLMFVTAEPSDPFAAVLKLDDPLAEDASIRAAVQAGFLVRTRADSVTEPRAGDTRRRDTALAGGAHMISTDYPAPGLIEGYWVEIPGGTPSRCNPVTAPPDCVAADLEDIGSP
ncbi:MAG: hypothetical protein HYY13_05345 [Nitrospirae bacterium]|nr:hypothetical protein [Nitrospirota bacterium]